MKLKVFTLVGLALTFSACSKDRNNAAPTIVDPIVVQPSDVSTCTVQPGRFKCTTMGTSTTEGPIEGRLRVVVKMNRRGDRMINVDHFNYKADGRIHRATNELGNPIEYSVTCVGDTMEINARGPGTPVATQISLSALNTRRPALSFIMRNTVREMRANGTCSLSR